MGWDEPHGTALPQPAKDEADEEDGRGEISLEEGLGVKLGTSEWPESLQCVRRTGGSVNVTVGRCREDETRLTM